MNYQRIKLRPLYFQIPWYEIKYYTDGWPEFDYYEDITFDEVDGEIEL